jgi:hypothetical protein
MPKTFHWRNIANSKTLQLLLAILKDASGPMTGMEIQLEAQRRGTWIANPSTTIGELGENPGYVVSPGTYFPDRKYRYWLISAPGWRPSWQLLPVWDTETGRSMVDYRIAPWTPGQHPQPVPQARPAVPQPVIATPAAQEDPAPRFCKNALCGKPLTNETPWCDPDCRAAWREQLGAGSTPAQKGHP